MVDYNIVCMFMLGKAKPSEEDNNPLSSPAAQSVLGMGYSKVKVQHVIDKFVAEKGRFLFDDHVTRYFRFVDLKVWSKLWATFIIVRKVQILRFSGILRNNSSLTKVFKRETEYIIN